MRDFRLRIKQYIIDWEEIWQIPCLQKLII